MNKMERALFELGEMDALAAKDSLVHARHPLSKLTVTVAYILSVLAYHKYDLAGLFVMIMYPVIVFQLCGIPVSTCFRKLRMVLPLVMAVGLANPFFDHSVALTIGGVIITGGVLSMLTLMLKGVFCLMASFLLIATTSIDALCAALRKLHVPAMLVALLLLTYRYVGVMTEEIAVMNEAYHLRAPRQKGIHHSAWGSFLGQVLLRSMDRAQELYYCMQLRGYHGEYQYALIKPFQATDGLWLLGWVVTVVLLRWLHVTQLLGEMLVG